MEFSSTQGQQEQGPGSPGPGDYVVECRHVGPSLDDLRVVLLRWRLDDTATLLQTTFFVGDAIGRFEDAAMSLAQAVGRRAWRRVGTASGFELLPCGSAHSTGAHVLCVWSLARRGGRCYNATLHEERGGWDLRLTADDEVLQTQRHGTMDDALRAAETLRLATTRRRR